MPWFLIFDSFNLLYSALTCVILILLWFYVHSGYDYWQKLNIKSVKPIPVFGNIASFVLKRKAYHETMQDIYKALDGQPFGGFYQMAKPMLMINDPKLITRVLSTDFKIFSSRGPVLFFSYNIKLNRHILIERDNERWKLLRQNVSSVYTPSKVKQMHEQVSLCVASLIEHVEKQMDGNGSTEVALKYLCDKLTVDAIALTAFGVTLNSFERSDNFATFGRKILEPDFTNIVWLLTNFISDRIKEKLNVRDLKEGMANVFQNFIQDLMTHRKESGESRNDLLQLLMSLQNSHVDPKFAVAKSDEKIATNGIPFTEIDVAANAFAIFLAGFETTSSTLSFCLYELALNEDIQEKLRSEVEEITERSGGLNSNSFKEMIYMQAVINETLRKYPVVPVLTRQCNQDYEIPGTNIRIPAFSTVTIPVWSIHHDSKYYQNPEIFDPDRFIEEKKLKQPQLLLPFGDGPRYCLGKYFGETELKLSIATILLKYNVKRCSKTEVPLKFNAGFVLLQSNCGVWVNLIKRKM